MVRFVDAEGSDVIERKDGVWKLGPLVQRTTAALEAAEHPVPNWLQALATETSGAPTEQLALSMHCFWDGQAKLGAIPGIVASSAAFVGGAEVVALRFDPEVIALTELVSRAQALGCARRVFTTSAAQQSALEAAGVPSTRLEDPMRQAPASDQLRHLSASPLRLLPLTPLQAQILNSELAAGQEAGSSSWLSPRQAALVAPLLKARSLKGLQRPDSLAGLADYSAQLKAKLEAAE